MRRRQSERRRRIIAIIALAIVLAIGVPTGLGEPEHKPPRALNPVSAHSY